MNENSRYQKHFLLDEIGKSGQKKLSESKVLIIGAGGLGVPVIQYLASMGVGEMGIVDADVISITNLHRQVIYPTEKVGILKVNQVEKFINDLNPSIKVECFSVYLTIDNAFEIIEKYDVVVDCTDNVDVRYCINDVCEKLNKPWVFGAIYKFQGQVTVFNYTSKGVKGPSYRCLNPEVDNYVPSCSDVGVAGVLPGVIGTLQATEVLKVLLNIGNPLSGILLLVDLLTMEFDKIHFERQYNPPINFLNSYSENCHTNQIIELNHWQEISILDENKELIDVREPWEVEKESLGIKNIPLSELPVKRAHLLNTCNRIVFLCQKGVRSKRAAQWMIDTGCSLPIYTIKGGIDSLKIIR